MSELLHVLEPSFDGGPESLKATPPPANMPSKTNWHKPYGITHAAQQRADFEQERLKSIHITCRLQII